MVGTFVIVVAGVVALSAMAIFAVGALRALRRGGSGLPYLALPTPLEGATRRGPVVLIGHTDLDQAAVTGNGGLWINGQAALFHSAAGTLTMPRPLESAEVSTEVPELGFQTSGGEPVLALRFTTAAGQPAVAAFRTPDATGWALALQG